jgi:hypothetical protein
MNMFKPENIRMVDPNTLKKGPIRRESLSQEQMQRVKELCNIFPYHFDNQDEVVSDFCRDVNPSREIGFWEGIAKVIRDYLNELPTSKMRKDACNLLFITALGSKPNISSLSATLQEKMLKSYGEYVISDEYLDAQEADVIADWETAGLNSEFSSLYQSHLDKIASIRTKKSML